MKLALFIFTFISNFLLFLSSSFLPYWEEISIKKQQLMMFSKSAFQIYLIFNTFCEVKWSEVAQSCPTLCDPMDCRPPGSSTHGIFQARVLEWVAISFSRGSYRPRDQTQISHIAGRHFTVWTISESHTFYNAQYIKIHWLTICSNQYFWWQYLRNCKCPGAGLVSQTSPCACYDNRVKFVIFHTHTSHSTKLTTYISLRNASIW